MFAASVRDLNMSVPACRRRVCGQSCVCGQVVCVSKLRVDKLCV